MKKFTQLLSIHLLVIASLSACTTNNKHNSNDDEEDRATNNERQDPVQVPLIGEAELLSTGGLYGLLSRDEEGNTVLHNLVLAGEKDLVEGIIELENLRLLSLTKDLTDLKIWRAHILYKQNNEGNTALHLAAMEGNMEIASFLVMRGKKMLIRILNNQNKSAIELAQESGHNRLANVISSIGRL